MYSFVYKKSDKLPKLSWLAEISKGTESVTVFCGAKVECCDDFFVAGAWDGNFTNAGFDTSEMFCGTGAKLCADGVMFVTPSHALERLVYAQDDSRTVISNSLPFLLSVMGYFPDEKIDQYERLLCSILDGPDKMVKNIPLADGKQITQVIVSTILINKNCDINIAHRTKQTTFANFEDYYSRLMQTMQSLKENAASPERNQTHYGIITTLSSGYDSTACAAIAKKLGCDTTASLSGNQYDKDSGYDVAVQLGYEHIEKRDMYDYRRKSGCIDAKYLAGGEMATAMQFSVFDDLFADKLVLFGLRGSYWDKEPTMTENYEMIGYFNCEADVSITEGAIENGYIPVPVPTFGASACNSIFAISKSPEMSQWSIGGKYDKPIPRRILETEGVSRESFGQIKYGGGFSLSRDNKSRLKKRMSKDGYAAFTRYLSEGKGLKWSIRRVVSLIKYLIINLPSYFNYAFSLLHIPIRFKQKTFRMANPGVVAELFFWSTDVMKKAYSDALCADCYVYKPPALYK